MGPLCESPENFITFSTLQRLSSTQEAFYINFRLLIQLEVLLDELIYIIKSTPFYFKYLKKLSVFS